MREFLATHWPQIVRTLWWGAALLFSLLLIASRYDAVTSKDPTPFDKGLMGLAVILILLPFISEITAFGFTVKKQIDKAKKELKEDIQRETQLIRNEILTLAINDRLTSNVVPKPQPPNPPPDRH